MVSWLQDFDVLWDSKGKETEKNRYGVVFLDAYTNRNTNEILNTFFYFRLDETQCVPHMHNIVQVGYTGSSKFQKEEVEIFHIG